MTNKKFWVGMLVMVLVFSVFSGEIIQAQTGSPLNGTWVNADGFAYTFNNGDFSVTGMVGGIRMNFDSGTYTINGSTVTVSTRLFGTFRADFSINGNVLTWMEEGGAPQRFTRVQ